MSMFVQAEDRSVFNLSLATSLTAVKDGEIWIVLVTYPGKFHVKLSGSWPTKEQAERAIVLLTGAVDMGNL